MSLSKISVLLHSQNQTHNKMKKYVIVFFAAFLFCGSVKAQAQNDSVTLYFSAEEMPDLIKCLPPPPDTIGIDFAQDTTLRFGSCRNCHT